MKHCLQINDIIDRRPPPGMIVQACPFALSRCPLYRLCSEVWIIPQSHQARRNCMRPIPPHLKQQSALDLQRPLRTCAGDTETSFTACTGTQRPWITPIKPKSSWRRGAA